MVAKGKDLPDQDHVIRHVPWSKLRKDEDENVIGFLPQAFELRPEEAYLSANWLEYFGGDHEQRIREAVRAYRKKVTVRKRAHFGIANIGKLKEVCRSSGATVRIAYWPTTDHPSHAAIRNYPREDLSLFEAMAVDAFAESVRNADVTDSALSEEP